MNIIYNQSPHPIDFTNSFPNWETEFHVYDRDQDEVYKRIICTWKDEYKIEHQYHAVINTKTGDLYIDCRRRKLLAKHITFIILRPLHTLVKTFWHASLIGPLALEIFKIAKGQQSKTEGLKNFGISILDIALTPFYGIAMTITSIATVIISPVSPNILYRGQEVAGWLERKMYRTKKLRGATILTPCFSPIANISTVHQVWGNSQPPRRTVNNVRIGLSNLTKQHVIFRQNHPSCFNNFKLHPKDQPYISAAAPKSARSD